MKKAKIMLTAIAVIGVVGGVLAFKAKKAPFLTVYTEVNGLCTSPFTLTDASITNDPSATPIQASLTTLQAECPTIYYTAE